jgi:hypothetical protein
MKKECVYAYSVESGHNSTPRLRPKPSEAIYEFGRTFCHCGILFGCNWLSFELAIQVSSLHQHLTSIGTCVMAHQFDASGGIA